ncbi:NAD(P)/FAD-dependent oxidoreductase [Flavobacterium sp.]|uniref:NAD(P)/FAD-dependent oxidoreductase n=1 Tax=Flavobacterium sp. TaxID=239 RepID=UPI0039E5F8E3
MRHIVVIGGGFAGLNFVKNLRKEKKVRITLVDRENYNFFPPLLYQLATGYLETSNICYPYRKQLQGWKNVTYHMGEVLRIEPKNKTVVLSTGKLEYDCLVLATGVETNYFGMENIKANALPMKTVNDALALKNHLFRQMESVSIRLGEGDCPKQLNVVVAGAGPTGVEISGMLSDMKRFVLPKDYPELARQKVSLEVYLVDGGDSVLKPMSEKTHKSSYLALERLGVKIVLGTTVKDYQNGKVVFGDGSEIETNTLIWAAGVSGAMIEGIPAECYGRGKRLIADAFHKVEGFPNLFAIGDTSIQAHDPSYPNGHPQVAQVALQQGMNLAKNLSVIFNGRGLLNVFAYKDKGSMAIIGRNKAVVDLPKGMHFSGFFAWAMWLFVHLVSLQRTRNKITTLYNWVVAYVTKDQSLRMIIGNPKR